MNIQTVQFAHILENRDLETLHDFLSHTAFVISHKNESIETILKVLWYIPASSTIIVVTNCQEGDLDKLTSSLKCNLADHRQTYVIHQKDGEIARLFKTSGVSHILGADGKVVDGKGEGMYIGALCAHLLGYLQWIIFYDADNFVPSALLEYTLAMCRLFTSTPCLTPEHMYDTRSGRKKMGRQAPPNLHNVRICWASKPDVNGYQWGTRILGRTTRVVSPLFESLLESWFGIHNHSISSSNAGEQGMTIQTATSLRFSSGFSVETFLFLDLLFNALKWKEHSQSITFQQYLSQSPHFHEKKDDEHIKKMIEESLGCFLHFESALPENVKVQLQCAYDELQLERVYPAIYPSLQSLLLKRFSKLMKRYALFGESLYTNTLASTLDVQEPLALGVHSQELLKLEVSTEEHAVIRIHTQEHAAITVPIQEHQVPHKNGDAQDILLSETNY